MNLKDRQKFWKRYKRSWHKIFITDPAFLTQKRAIFKKRLLRLQKKHHPTITIFRDKTHPNPALFIRFLPKNIFINSYWRLAKRWGFLGVHMPSSMIKEAQRARRVGLMVIVSTHNKKELLLAKRVRAHFATFSPIFATPNKGAPKGLRALRKARLLFGPNLIALGGITHPHHIKAVKKAKVSGFASIRYFVN